MNNNNSSTFQAPKETRKDLFLCLEFIIGVSNKKIKTPRVKDKSKQGWARIMVSAISAYGSLLKDHELESLEQRVSLLENQRLEEVISVE